MCATEELREQLKPKQPKCKCGGSAFEVVKSEWAIHTKTETYYLTETLKCENCEAKIKAVYKLIQWDIDET